MHAGSAASGSAGLSFSTPDLHFGAGVCEALPRELSARSVAAPLVVTDDGVAEAGVLDAVLDAMGGSATTYFATTEPGTDDFGDIPTDVDGVVAVGGGSCLDTAKMAAILLSHGGEPADYLGVDRVPGPVVPIFAVPTTSGTGSQATQTAVLAHEGVKQGVSDERLRPAVAFVDPTFTIDLPRKTTARSGFDAFVHALESFAARDYRWVPERPITYQGANPLSRPLSRQALELVHGGLERAVLDGDDREARWRLSLGSHLAGVAFSNAGLGIVHALASTAGGMTGRAHGACLAACVTAGLTYNLPVRREAYGDVARSIGVAEDGTAAAAAALVEECDRLRSTIDLPGSMAELGLGPDDLDDVVERTLAQDRRLATNPRVPAGDLSEVVAESLGA